MFDHVGFNVSDFTVSKRFYVNATAPLKLNILSEGDGWAVIGNKEGHLWFGSYGAAATPIHIALKASSRREVDEFYRFALAAGGRDNGPPGLRPEYAADYYAAFIFDPDGHNIEAVTHSLT